VNARSRRSTDEQSNDIVEHVAAEGVSDIPRPEDGCRASTRSRPTGTVGADVCDPRHESDRRVSCPTVARRRAHPDCSKLRPGAMPGTSDRRGSGVDWGRCSPAAYQELGSQVRSSRQGSAACRTEDKDAAWVNRGRLRPARPNSDEQVRARPGTARGDSVVVSSPAAGRSPARQLPAHRGMAPRARRGSACGGGSQPGLDAGYRGRRVSRTSRGSF